MLEDYRIPARDGHPSVIYFLRDYFRGDIKIGTSWQFPQRLSALRTQYGRNLVCLGVQPGGYDRESELHRRFRPLRTRGEWFAAQPELLDYIMTKTVPFELYCRGLVVREGVSHKELAPDKLEEFLDAMERGEAPAPAEPRYYVMLGSWERVWWERVFNDEIDAIAMPPPSDAFRFEYQESIGNLKRAG